jgi:hypothetical protein
LAAAYFGTPGYEWHTIIRQPNSGGLLRASKLPVT